MDYRVALDIYRGPLDLLLYLIQENEVEIADIPIAKITEQYLCHLGVIESLDPNVAGEFLVMAATLMEIKSRMLLPRPEKVEGQADDGDPRIELIRQLMEYKRFKEAASLLADRREEHLDRFGRGARQTFGEASDADAVDLTEVSIWDILGAFDRIMRETMRSSPTTITNRDVPIRTHIEAILRMLRVQGMVTFRSIFETCEDRLEAIGSLLALLEMTRWRVIGLEQTASHGTILVKLAEEAETNIAKLMNALSAHPDSTAAPMEGKSPAPAPAEEVPPPPAEAAETGDAPLNRHDGTVPESGQSLQGGASPVSEPEPVEAPAEEEPAPVEDDEERDEDLDRIRSIEIHDVDLSLGETPDQKEDQTHEEPSDADRAAQEGEHQPAVEEEPEPGRQGGAPAEAATPGTAVNEPPGLPDDPPAEEKDTP